MLENSSEDIAKDLVSNILEVDKNTIDTDSGIETVSEWDSIKHMSIILTLENVLGRELETEEIFSAVNIRGIAMVLQSSSMCNQAGGDRDV